MSTRNWHDCLLTLVVYLPPPLMTLVIQAWSPTRSTRAPHNLSVSPHDAFHYINELKPTHCSRICLKEGVIEPSSSPWTSPIVLVKKKDGSTHFCVHYCKLNEVTVKDSYSKDRPLLGCACRMQLLFHPRPLQWVLAGGYERRMTSLQHRQWLVAVHRHEFWSLQCPCDLWAAGGECVVWRTMGDVFPLLRWHHSPWYRVWRSN